MARDDDPTDVVEVSAAGGVIHRRRDDRQQVVLVHRPRYDDWSFPKGKLDRGETFEQAAVREVFEEADIVVVLGEELPSVRYRDHKGRSKLARYWAMTVAVQLDFEADDEVDERVWLDRQEARRRLTYDHDRSLLDALPSPSAKGPERS